MRLSEMLIFDQETIDHFAGILEKGEPWAIQTIYDELEEYGIPDGEEAVLFRELLPEIVAWFNNAITHEALAYSVIDYAVFLIQNENLTALIPFVVRSLKANKTAVIKHLLTLIKTNHEGALARDLFNDLSKFNLNWPELAVIKKSLEAF